MIQQLIFIAIAGALGTLSRYAVSTFANRIFGGDFPFGTLLVNFAGCLLIGFVTFLSLQAKVIPESERTVICVGFLGGLTTFSTFSYETVRYIENGVWQLALVNAGLNLGLGIAAVIGGAALARIILNK
jgi:fluoride exporter